MPDQLSGLIVASLLWQFTHDQRLHRMLTHVLIVPSYEVYFVSKQPEAHTDIRALTEVEVYIHRRSQGKQDSERLVNDSVVLTLPDVEIQIGFELSSCSEAVTLDCLC